MFFGYYLSALTMVAEETGPPVPELARRGALAGCDHDPVRQLAATLARMPGDGIPLSDVTGDSGYAHRDAQAWAIPLRQAGAQLVQDLHPHDRGPQGTHAGAIIANGSLYCPQTPRTLLELGPLPATPPRKPSPRTTHGPPNSPGTSSAGSPATTPTDTTASPAPPSPARSAAPSGRTR